MCVIPVSAVTLVIRIPDREAADQNRFFPAVRLNRETTAELAKERRQAVVLRVLQEKFVRSDILASVLQSTENKIITNPGVCIA